MFVGPAGQAPSALEDVEEKIFPDSKFVLIMTDRHIWALGSSLESLRLGYTLLANNQILKYFQWLSLARHSPGEERRRGRIATYTKVISDKLGFKLWSLFYPPSPVQPCPAHLELVRNWQIKHSAALILVI